MSRYDATRVCKKCSGDNVTTDYSDILDLIKRTCTRCGYRWTEEPLDRPKMPSIAEALGQDLPS